MTLTQSRFSGRADLDVERLVVDPDVAVSAVRRPVEVADHPLLEVAGRRLHRRLLGLDRSSSSAAVVDALAALERGELLAATSASRSAWPATCSASTALASTLARAFASSSRAPLERRLLVADLDLQTLAGARLLGDRPEGLERAGLLRDLQGGGVARAGSVSGGSLPTSPSSCAASTSIWATCASSRASRSSAVGEVGQARAPRGCCARSASTTGELGLHLGAAAEAPVDLDVAELGPMR